jgi:hypothetical protein
MQHPRLISGERWKSYRAVWRYFHWETFRQLVCKVFEIKGIGLELDLSSYAKSRSPAWAGLGVFPDLSLSAESMGLEGFDLFALADSVEVNP